VQHSATQLNLAIDINGEPGVNEPNAAFDESNTAESSDVIEMYSVNESECFRIIQYQQEYVDYFAIEVIL